ncbi:MAG: hypothetical protein JJE09_04675 [Bacteroidia bacterium]|nr:hypothetical protein [Bacteroidia bacterium]
MYPSREIAEDALIEARTQFEYKANQGPIDVYMCEDCGYYHLTSQGKMNDKLATQLKDGKIKLQKEANQWMNKIKKR